MRLQDNILGPLPKKLPPFSPLTPDEKGVHYLCSPELKDAVQIALATGMPLLLTGEPGTGKTMLAYYLAQEVGLGKPLVFHVKSTTTAQDLFYQYDALRHFHYSQRKDTVPLSPEEVERQFIRYNALGKAMMSSERQVVLLDEVDKAPRDLPNDILNAIENMEFEVPEVQRTGDKSIRSSAALRPVLILTSNSEKSLPDAFLRRCVYFHIQFPDRAGLRAILREKFPKAEELDLDAMSEHTLGVRAITKEKKPATAEIVQWAAHLDKQGFKFYKLRGLFSNPSLVNVLEDWDRQLLGSSYSILVKNEKDLQRLLSRLEPMTD